MSVNVLVSLVAPAIVLWPTLSSASRWTWCWSSVAVPNCCLARYDSIQLSYQTRPLRVIKVKSGLLANCSFGSRKISSEKDQSFFSKVRLMLTKSNKGAFSNYVDIIMPFSVHIPTSPWTAFTSTKMGVIWTNYPHHLVHVVIECPLNWILLNITWLLST